MAYSAEINRQNPACLLLLIDQSYSMAEPWKSQNATKAQALSLMVNRLLANSVMLCTRGGAGIYSYFDVGVVGYGADVKTVLAGTSQSQPLIGIDKVATSPIRVETISRKVPDGAGGLTEIDTKMRIWVEAAADNGTPMVAALRMAEKIASAWCQQHPNSFPPLVLNITDGESQDGDPTAAAEALRKVRVADGETLLFNIHLSGIPAREILLPSDDSGLAEPAAKVLFNASSILPDPLRQEAAAAGFAVSDGARGFIYNADATSLIEFLDLGTKAVMPTGIRSLESGTGSR